jgi:hypothetical protein
VPTVYLLAPIEVTGTRARATAPPVATIVVDPVTIQTTPAENSYDLIRRTAGLEVHDQGQGPGFSSNVVLRGFTADHSSDVLLTIDGVPQNLPVHGHVEGYADWTPLFAGAVSSLRVIHGPSSPLHGDFSIAGAVEVYTQPDADGWAGNLTANGFGDLSGWVTAGRRSESGGALAGLDLRRTEGWRDHSEKDIGNVLFRGWRSAGQGRIEGGLALHAARWDSPGFLSLTQFGQGDFEGAADQTDGGNQSRIVAHGRYATPIGPSRFLQWMGWGLVSDLDLFLTTPGHEDAFGNLYQSSESDRRWGAGTEAEVSWLPSSHEVTVGVSLRTDRSEYDKNRTLRRSRIDGEVAVDAEHTAAGLYLRWRKTVMDRLGLDLGARVDHLRYRSFNRLGLEEEAVAASLAPAGAGTRVGDIIILEPGPAVFHIIGDQGPVGEWVRGDQTIVSPKLGARFSLTDRVTLTASSSRGFRSAVGVLGDPDRPPFLAWAQEVGVEFAQPGLDAHLSLFRTDVTNERTQDPITLAISSAGSSVRQGMEATLSVEAGRGIVLSGRGTYTDAQLSGRYADAHHDHGDDGSAPPETPSEGEAGGQRVPGIAKYLGSLSASFPLMRDIEGRIDWRVTGGYVPIGEPDALTDAFSVLDFGVSVPLREGLFAELEVRNVLDEAYAEMRSSGYVNPGAPRSIGLGFHYQGN